MMLVKNIANHRLKRIGKSIRVLDVFWSIAVGKPLRADDVYLKKAHNGIGGNGHLHAPAPPHIDSLEVLHRDLCIPVFLLESNDLHMRMREASTRKRAHVLVHKDAAIIARIDHLLPAGQRCV